MALKERWFNNITMIEAKLGGAVAEFHLPSQNASNNGAVTGLARNPQADYGQVYFMQVLLCDLTLT
jgi:hypothetical protein